jgi:hypothetical protein
VSIAWAAVRVTITGRRTSIGSVSMNANYAVCANSTRIVDCSPRWSDCAFCANGTTRRVGHPGAAQTGSNSPPAPNRKHEWGKTCLRLLKPIPHLRGDPRWASAYAAIIAGLTTPVLAGATPPNPDAELIALCAEFYRQNEVARAVPDHDEDGLDAAVEVRWEISIEIEDIEPVAPAGHKAKAGVALFLLRENYGSDGSREGSTMRFAFTALHEIAGSAVE